MFSYIIYYDNRIIKFKYYYIIYNYFYYICSYLPIYVCMYKSKTVKGRYYQPTIKN